MRLSIAVLAFLVVTNAGAQSKRATITADASHLRYTISRNIYGQFSEHLGKCIYEGLWVGEASPIPNTRGIRNDVVAALRKIKVPVIRWPGGCFADEYHWKDGIGPRQRRPSMINTNWGGVTEDNSFGTHEFLDLCSQIGCEPYVTGNVGSGTVQELSQWVEYVNSDNVSPLTMERKENGRDTSWGVKYWAIGNESWGCGGNMRPDFYADQARRYGTYMRTYGSHSLYKVACGPSGDDSVWTEVLMKEAGSAFNGLALHWYAFAGSRVATDFDEHGWADVLKKSLRMEELVRRHGAIMDRYDPHRRIGLIVDEWGTWYRVEPGTNPGFLYQQNTMRDAVAAACNLNIFNNHCDRVKMANIAQMVNVLQAMVLTDNEKLILTPTYHVFDLFSVHQDARWVPTDVTSQPYIVGRDTLPSLTASASIDIRGRMHLSVCNIDPHSSILLECNVKKYHPTKVSGRIVAAKEMNAHNTFDHPDAVKAVPFTGGELRGDRMTATLPPMSVVTFEFEGTADALAPRTPSHPVPGVRCLYFEGAWTSLPGFAALTPKRSLVVSEFALPEPNAGENFGVRYEGYIRIPADGSYTFGVTSDDGANLIIDGETVVDNDGLHGPQETTATTVLRAGYHAITVDYFQAGWGKAFEVSVEGSGMTKQAIPAGLLFHEKQ
jgi:alpha-N-arabinofuranosidase